MSEEVSFAKVPDELWDIYSYISNKIGSPENFKFFCRRLSETYAKEEGDKSISDTFTQAFKYVLNSLEEVTNSYMALQEEFQNYLEKYKDSPEQIKVQLEFLRRELIKTKKDQ